MSSKKTPVEVIAIWQSDDESTFKKVATNFDETLEVFQKQPGFISCQILQSAESNKVVSLLKWESEKNHLDCMQSPDWGSVPGAQEWMQAVESGKLNVSAEIYNTQAKS